MVIISIKMPRIESIPMVPMRYLLCARKIVESESKNILVLQQEKGANENRGRNERECWTHSIESRAVQFTCYEWDRVY